jgi:hypothetical protein
MAQSVDHIPLPTHAHIPGSNQRHAEDFLDPVKKLASEQTQDANAANNIAWLYGLRLIDLGYHWEAHEILETVWMHAAPNSRERQLVQGIIHLANAVLKVKMERQKAALRLLDLAETHIVEAFAGHREKTLMLLRHDDLKKSLTLDSHRNPLAPK